MYPLPDLTLKLEFNASTKNKFHYIIAGLCTYVDAYCIELFTVYLYYSIAGREE